MKEIHWHGMASQQRILYLDVVLKDRDIGLVENRDRAKGRGNQRSIVLQGRDHLDGQKLTESGEFAKRDLNAWHVGVRATKGGHSVAIGV